MLGGDERVLQLAVDVERPCRGRDVPQICDRDFEPFTSPQPFAEKFGWRHVIVERRLLSFGGADFQSATHALRPQGLETEPRDEEGMPTSLDPEGCAVDETIEEKRRTLLSHAPVLRGAKHLSHGRYDAGVIIRFAKELAVYRKKIIAQLPMS